MLQHQIVQSPARLGLTNPNSPSLPPPSIQQHPQITPSTSTSPATSISPSPAASNVLLPLLPPLRRAQSLLAQMASLSGKLFEVSPNRSAWLASFRGSLPSFLSSSASSAGPAGGPAATTTKEVLSQIAALQKQLFEAVAQLQEILDLQDSRAKIAREIRARDASAIAFAARLKDAEKLLDDLLDDYSHYRKPPKKNEDEELRNDDEDEDEEEGDSATTVKTRLRLSDVLSYAHRISYTTFAPPEFGAGEAPLRGALPPAPQDEQMRASQLYSSASLDVGLPESEPENRSFEPMIEAPPLPAPAPEFGRFPANITVPAGWKPGMPVELPTTMPVPPPGWKPGDPVPLPPAMVIPAMRPAKAAGETIQVQHVQLDILDQDDDSSDYSSDDDGSSDED